MHVWAIQQGEAHQGGHIIGLYFTKQAARGDFTRAARHLRVTISEDAWKDNEPVRWRDDCDWLTLEPLQVKGEPTK